MFCLENLVKAVCCASPMAGVGMGCKRALLDIGWHTGRHRTFPPAHKNCTSDTKASRPPPVVEALAPRVVLEEKRRRRPVSARLPVAARVRVTLHKALCWAWSALLGGMRAHRRGKEGMRGGAEHELVRPDPTWRDERRRQGK